MKKIILLIIGTLVATAAVCQVQTTDLVEVSRVWKRKDVTISNGLIYKYTAEPTNDTARYFNPGQDRYEVTMTFKKIVDVSPPILIQAESANPIQGATIDVGGATICCIQPGALLQYGTRDLGKRTKVRFRFSRGNPGNGTLTLKIGTTSIPCTFPSTGSWSTFQESEFAMPVGLSGAVSISSGQLGPCNLDWFGFE